MDRGDGSTGVVLISPFPPYVGFALLADHGDAVCGAPHPDELALLRSGTIPQRRREFALGRIAANRALKAIGICEPPPILRAQDDAPLWPDGVVGSITHCTGRAAACAAWRRDADGVGLDLVGLHRAPTVDIAPRIADRDERAWIDANPEQRQRRLLSLFSAKESVFKALYPLRREYFGFDAVHLDSTHGGFIATLRENMNDDYRIGHHVQIAVVDVADMILTAIILPVRAEPS